MKNVCIILPLIFAETSSVVIDLNTNANGHFELNYSVVGRSGGPFTARLLLAPFSEQVRQGAVGENFNITTVDNEQIYTPNLLHQLGDFIFMGFRSVFASEVARTYMMIPMNRQLVINPESPETFVFGGVLTTTRSTSEYYPQVRVSVSVLITPRSPTGEFVPTETLVTAQNHIFDFDSFSPHDFVPVSVLLALYDDLRRRDIPCEPVFTGGTIRSFVIRGDLSDEVIDTFPIIQFRIHTDSGTDINIELDGRDYIGPLVAYGRRQLALRAGRATAFGVNTLSKVALFVDNGNRTIGFGEPL